MVVYYKCELVSPPYIIYIGADKYENDKLIRWGWPEDVWFHVDKLSSAHVYLRLREGETLDDVPEAVIQDCAQLCKENSIQGCKQNDVSVVYTMWENLRKEADMEVGQVGFHNSKAVRRTVVAKRCSEILKRLEKTASHVSPFSTSDTPTEGASATGGRSGERSNADAEEAALSVEARLRAEREARDARVRARERNAQRARERAERAAAEARAAEAERCDYARMFAPEAMRSNQDGGYDSDDFM